MIKFKCKDFLLKECEFEAKGMHSVDEMMKLVEVHAGDEQRTLKLSLKTIEKIRSSLEKQAGAWKTLGWTLWPHEGLGGDAPLVFLVLRLRNTATDAITRTPAAIPPIRYTVLSGEDAEVDGGWTSEPVTLTHPVMYVWNKHSYG